MHWPLRLATLLATFTAAAAALACPIVAERPAALVVVRPDKTTIGMDAAALQALPAQQREVRRSVAGAAATHEQGLRYDGVLLRDLLERTLPDLLASRAARGLVVEAVATDGYVAVFSWGELFNSTIGDQVLVVRAQDDQPLDLRAGPLALRALADLRPGPRHVRNLCAVVLRGS